MSEAAGVVDSGIISDPSIHRGEPILAGTATPVRAIVELWNQGTPAEVIPLHLPHLGLAQVFEALHYYLGHRLEIDQHIQANRIPEESSGKRFDPATGQVQIAMIKTAGPTPSFTHEAKYQGHDTELSTPARATDGLSSARGVEWSGNQKQSLTSRSRGV